jgi:hypothetical protein
MSVDEHSTKMYPAGQLIRVGSNTEEEEEEEEEEEGSVLIVLF